MSEKNSSIQEKTDKLTEMVAWFNGDDFSLEEAIAKFKAAEKLAVEIEQDLINLKNEINVIKQRFDSEK